MLMGCVTQQVKPTVERIEFPENEYAQLKSIGSSVVRGQAFLKTMGGDVKFAAGGEILLNPVTSYSNQWFDAYLNQESIAPHDPRLMQYIRTTIGDGSGRFEFKNVPSGEYYLAAEVTWKTSVYAGVIQQQGGWIAKKIRVSDHEEIDVVLTL